MQPNEERLLKTLGLYQPTQKETILRLIGTIIGNLLCIALWCYAFMFAFNLTLPQGLVLGWVLTLLLDAIRNGGRK